MRRVCLAALAWLAMAAPSETKPVRPPIAPVPPNRTPIKLEHDVIVCDFGDTLIPFVIDDRLKMDMRALRMFVSEDRGKTWKLAEERMPNEKHFRFHATQDGLFWFAIQTVQLDGTRDPANEKKLAASLKVYFNKEKRPVERTAGTQ